MACLELRQGSKWWYGRWNIGGKLIVQNLDVEVEGRRPPSVNQEGDGRFERSRGKAQAELEKRLKASKEQHRATDLVQTYHRLQTGTDVPSVSLKTFPQLWAAQPRRSSLSPTQLARAQTVFKRFLAFMAGQHPKALSMADVTHEMAVEFMNVEAGRHIAGRTYNKTLKLMRNVFKLLRRHAGLLDNPFEDIAARDEHTIHRQPFSVEELNAILAEAQSDPFCRPLVITGACTAMRLGDVCRLRWCDVDLKQGGIRIKTAKTGAPVSIPIFSMLKAELEALPKTSAFCFPEQAEKYATDPSYITKRLGRIFARAGFGDLGTKRPQQLPPPEEIQRKWSEEFPQHADQFGAKVRQKLPQVLDQYLHGGTMAEIMRQQGLSKGAVSGYLKRIEGILGFSIVRAVTEKINLRVAACTKHKEGQRRVNQRGFHALRSTWVTLALNAGVPIEQVRIVTGHTVLETVRKNYFQPSAEQFRQTLKAAMPKMLTAGGAPSRDDQMREILTKTSAKSWASDSKRLLELLDSK